MRKLIILPGVCDALGGTLVTLSLLIQGLEESGAAEKFCVLVQAGSITEKYLQQAGQSAYLELIRAKSKPEFLKQALRWVQQQPKNYPLLLDNCVERALLPTLLLATPALRFSGREVYHFCHDLALSYNQWGYLLRKITFSCLSPKAMCNSHFTASYVQRLMPDIRGILYQPVDTKRFYHRVSSTPPTPLQAILNSGAKLILTPSRISSPTKMVNDKNLRALIPVLAHLKANGHFYHSLVIGQDTSPAGTNTRQLLEAAENAGVSDRFTILPPTFAIEDYYQYASVVVTLAPREPFGRTVVEAIASGVPVIGSQTGGIGEILNHFAPEWTVDPADPEATAKTIVRVSTDSNTPKLLVQGRKWVESECSITGYAQKMMNITGLETNPVSPDPRSMTSVYSASQRLNKSLLNRRDTESTETSTYTTVQTPQPDILVISRVFFPDAGGIQEYAYNRCLQDQESVVVLTSGCAGDSEFDRKQPFPIYRWSMPEMSRLGKLGGLLKQILNMFWSVVLGIRLYQRYRFRSIEWCHGYDFPALLLLSYLLPVQCFIYLHGDDVLCPQKNPVFRWLFEWTLQRTKVIVCNSTFTQNYLKDHFQIERPTQIIHPTVRTEKFGLDCLKPLNLLRTEIRQKHQIPQEAIVILSVGRLVRRKGFDRVIQHLPDLVSKGIDVYYLICGRGAMESELRLLADNLGVTSRVIFAGYVPDEELAGYYAACDIFSMLTFFDSKVRSIEGFGIVYLEAGYFGKPTIASRVGGVEDAVLHQESGLLVDPNSSDEIFEMLRQLCSDRELRDRLGTGGKKLASRITLHRSLYTTPMSTTVNL